MDLLAKLQEDMKLAMKAGDKQRLGVIRMLISDVKTVDLMPNKPTPLQAVEAYARKLRKSLEEFQKINQQTQVDQLKYEIGIVEEYLPKKLTETHTAELVDSFLATGNFNEKQAGQAIGAFMKLHGAVVEANIASRLIRQRLAGK